MILIEGVILRITFFPRLLSMSQAVGQGGTSLGISVALIFLRQSFVKINKQ